MDLERTNIELEYYATSLRKIRNKKYELYVISCIIHRLDDLEIEFTTQQLVKIKEKVYLLDLYFPQLKLAIEIDERHHHQEEQIEKDKQREKEILDASEIKYFERISTFDINIIKLNNNINEIISHIKREKQKLIREGKFSRFEFKEKYNTDAWLAKRRLSVSDDARFRKHTDVARLFGIEYKQHQRAIFKLQDESVVWFPKLYKNKDWDNEISGDGLTIIMRKTVDGKYPMRESESKKVHYVFAHHIDEFGQVYYKFKGVFNPPTIETDRFIFRRAFDCFEYDGKGITRPIKDKV